MRTLFILPNAIGDVVCGLGIAHRFAVTGQVVWVANRSSAPLVADEGFEVMEPPSWRARSMRERGAPFEAVRREAAGFLTRLASSGPYDRVVNPHLSRASMLIAGAVMGGAREFRGPALGEKVASDPWSDFFSSSIALGLGPPLAAVDRFSLLSGFSEPIAPFFRGVVRREEAFGPIVVHPSAGWPSKRMGIAQVVETVRGLAARGEVMLMGGEGDREYLGEIGRLGGASGIMIGEIRSALCALASARALVTADTWALHAAAALELPFVSVQGATRILPRGPGFVLTPPIEPSFARDNDRTVDEVSPTDILRAFDALKTPSSTTEGIATDCIAWDCRCSEAEPSRPIDARQGGVAHRIFTWARAVAFDALVGLHSPGTPRARFATAGSIRRTYSEIGAIEEALIEKCAVIESFSIFPAMFPGRDAGRARQDWIEESARIVRTIARG